MNRRERRRAFKQMGVLKKKNELNWFHPDRVALRENNRKTGEQKHRQMLEEMEKAQYERMEHAAAEYIKKCKKEGYEGEELEWLEEAYALDVVRNKDTWQEDKKTRKRLRKQALESKNKRLS